MTKKSAWFIILLLTASCYRNTPIPTFDMTLIVPPDTMVNVLTDVHLLEGVVNTVNLKDTLMTELTEETLTVLMSRHGMDRKAFEENIHYYAYHAETLDEIYEKVIIRLGKLESEIIAQKDTLISQDTLSQPELSQPDSIPQRDTLE